MRPAIRLFFICLNTGTFIKKVMNFVCMLARILYIHVVSKFYGCLTYLKIGDLLSIAHSKDFFLLLKYKVLGQKPSNSRANLAQVSAISSLLLWMCWCHRRKRIFNEEFRSHTKVKSLLLIHA